MQRVDRPSKEAIIGDIRTLAEKLGHTPTHIEYLKHGKFSVYSGTKFFGSFSGMVEAAGLVVKSSCNLSRTESGVALSLLKKEIKDLKERLKAAEVEQVGVNTIRQLVGSMDCSSLGEGAAWIRGPKKLISTTGIPCLMFSDWHFDEVVHPEQIGFVNEYNRHIAEQRARRMFETSVTLLKRHMANPKYEGIVLALGGDLLSGNIHEELRETNEDQINRSILRATDVIISGIDLLLEEFSKVFVAAVVGNHPRLDKKPRAKNAVFDNFEWLIYQLLIRHYRSNPRVSFLVPEGPDAAFSVYNTRFLLTHGDQFRGGSGISGLLSPLMLGLHRKQKRQQAVLQPFDIMMIGHFHQYMHMQGLIANGSVKGMDEWAWKMNFGFEPPQQALFIVHPEHGITFRMPVLCAGDWKTRAKKGAKAVSW